MAPVPRASLPPPNNMTVWFLYGAGAETLNFGQRRLWKDLSPGRKKSAVYTKKPRKTEVQVSGAEIQTLAVDTRTAIWVLPLRKSF